MQQIKSIITEETNTKDELEKWRNERTAIEEQLKLYNKLQIEITRENGRIDGIKNKLETATSQATGARKLIEDIDSLKSPTELSDSEIGKQIKVLDKRIVKCRKDPRGENESIDALIERISDIRTSLEETKVEITKTDTMLENFETGKKELKAAGDICPVCGKELDEKHRKKKIAEYNKEIGEMKQRQSELTIGFETLTTDDTKFGDKYKVAQEKLVKALEKEKGQLEELREALEEYTTKVQSRKTWIDYAEKEESSLKSFAKELENLEKTISRLEGEIKSLADVAQKKTEIEKQIEQVQGELTGVSTDLATEKATKKQLNIRIKGLNQEITHKRDARNFASKLGVFENWLGEHLINLASTIEKHYMVELKRKFDPIFNEWFNLLIDDDQLDVRIDDEFTPIIEQDGYEAEYENLSGGEASSVALAYRLALNKVINTMVDEIKTKDIIILDEPTDGFSNDQMDKIRDVVNQLGAKQTIIVSHEPKIESYVDSIIRVRKEDGLSRIQTS